MGTRLKARRGRGGWIALVAFVLLFGSALAQAGSSGAIADDGNGLDPLAQLTATDANATTPEAPIAEGSSSGEATPEEASGTEEPAAAEDGNADGTVPAEAGSGGKQGSATPSSAPAVDAETSDGGTGSSPRSVVSTPPTSDRSTAGAAPTQPDTPGDPSGNGVQPTLLTGNRNCGEVLGVDLLFEYRADPPGDDSVDLAAASGGKVEGTLVIDVHGSLFDFTIVDGDPLAAVVVKGGSNANLFDYRPAGETADTDLHAPLNPANDQYYGLSHISFCWAEEEATLTPSIDVSKSCAPLGHEGDTIEYFIAVTNDGDEDLQDLTVTDTVLGDLSGSFPDTLAVGDSATGTFTHVVPSGGADPLVNEVSAAASGVQSGSPVSASDTCSTDIIHPGIAVVKTVSRDTVPVGTTVTYTYVVTNIGDTTLYDVSVDDDILGHIGDIAILEPGASVTLTKDFVVGDEPVTNVATVSGSDILGRSVNATDDASVAPILGGTTSPPGPGGEGGGTAFTGSEVGRLGFVALALFGLGVGVVAATRRRRPQRDSL